MVYSGEREKVRKFMEMGPERSKPLHNFTLPCLKWGNQKYLRCMKEESPAAGDQRLRRRSPSGKFEDLSVVANTRRRESQQSDYQQSSQNRRMKTVPSRSRVEDGEEGIDEVREKIMLDLKTAADKMKDAILREEVSDDDGEDDEAEEKAKGKEKEKEKEKKKEREESPAAAEEARPWNLRTRRSACKAPIGGAGNNHQNVDYSNNNNRGLKIDERRVNCSPMRSEVMKSPRTRDRGGLPEKKERAKFSVPLTKKEIEEDFMELVGHRPHRRPKKRPRNVQKQVDSLFPGLWLTEVTVDSYKVEIAENGKK